MASRFKQVSIMNEDYEAIKEVHAEWVKLHKAPISFPKFLRVAVDAYKEKLEG